MSRDRQRTPKENPAIEANRDKRRFIELTYMIIEHKIMYYNAELIAPGYRPGLEIDDHSYDALEKEYLRLCLKLKYPNTIVHHGYADINNGEDVPGDGMMEVDYTRPVVHLILRKYGIKGWQERCAQLNEKLRVQGKDGEAYRKDLNRRIKEENGADA